MNEKLENLKLDIQNMMKNPVAGNFLRVSKYNEKDLNEFAETGDEAAELLLEATEMILEFSLNLVKQSRL